MSIIRYQPDVQAQRRIQNLPEREATSSGIEGLNLPTIPQVPPGSTPVSLTTPVVLKEQPDNSAFTSRDVVATVNGSQLVGAKSDRKYLTISNKDLNNTIYLQFGMFQGASLNSLGKPVGVPILAGGSYEIKTPAPNTAVFAVAMVADVIVAIVEG